MGIQDPRELLSSLDPKEQEALNAPVPAAPCNPALGPRPEFQAESQRNPPREQGLGRAVRLQVRPCPSLSGLFSLFQACKGPLPQAGEIPLAAGTGSVRHGSPDGSLRFSSGLQADLDPHNSPSTPTPRLLHHSLIFSLFPGG